jgi:SAM-dependent methyltransferase
MDHPVCRICGESSHVLVSDKVSEAPDAAIYRCKGCDVVYQFPIMTDEEERYFYQSEFERYMEGRSGPGWKSPEQHFASYQMEGERRLPLIRTLLRKEHSVLEIGSSTGYFLDDMRGLVGAVTGIEPNPEYARFSSFRGIETLPSLESLRDRSFDLIFLYYVLEHLRDPIGYMAGLRSFLRPEGRVVLEVPNVEDALISTYTIPRFGPFYWQKAHYHYFSHHTLLHVLQKAGYKADTFPVQRYDLSNHLVWMMEGKPGGMGRFKSLFTPELEAAYADSLKARWVCDTVMAVARVNS